MGVERFLPSLSIGPPGGDDDEDAINDTTSSSDDDGFGEDTYAGDNSMYDSDGNFIEDVGNYNNEALDDKTETQQDGQSQGTDTNTGSNEDNTQGNEYCAADGGDPSSSDPKESDPSGGSSDNHSGGPDMADGYNPGTQANTDSDAIGDTSHDNSGQEHGIDIDQAAILNNYSNFHSVETHYEDYQDSSYTQSVMELQLAPILHSVPGFSDPKEGNSDALNEALDESSLDPNEYTNIGGANITDNLSIHIDAGVNVDVHATYHASQYYSAHHSSSQYVEGEDTNGNGKHDSGEYINIERQSNFNDYSDFHDSLNFDIGVDAAARARLRYENDDGDFQAEASVAADTNGNVYGGLGIGISFYCWVAREIYGVNNPNWIIFREWLSYETPNWILKLYIKYGVYIAKFISTKPLLKSFIKNWMDAKISSHEKKRINK